MKKENRIGIWMDHSVAILMELKEDKIVESTVASQFKQEEKEHLLDKGERLDQKKEQHQQSSYYHKLGDIIILYQKVLLFGPTDAKNELLNLLKSDHRFDKIEIEVKNSDKMTSVLMHGFVTEHFKCN
jgi:hypothetical protein